MTSAGLDPMQENTRRLVEALTTARSRAQTGDGLLAVEACADGQVRIHIDEGALRYGGSAIAAELTRLAAQALEGARAGVREATATFRADPRIEAALEATQDAMDQPLSAVQQGPGSSSPGQPSFGQPVSRTGFEQPASHTGFEQPPASQPAGQQSNTRTPPLYDPYDYEDDYDPYYQRKSWLEG
ncbi:hypothetical protein [Nocardia blacklockiae]|uniref:hypothetical protein n=1 Tax=Nocardia blacklockiae TaxID=480036 RepID=UPI0018943F02|nr:hypothetical protein [Nocardia blacklockiae]MBF6172723.1 hypothetical protein [Nocardia blacklockiae]